MTNNEDDFSQLFNWEEQQLLLHGWYTHYVPNGKWINAHTHGIEEKFEHPDLQVVLALPPNTVSGLFHSAIERIIAGHKLLPDQLHEGIIKGYPIKTHKSVEGDRSVLRIILPDKQGRFPGDPDCAPLFDNQEDIMVM